VADTKTNPDQQEPQGNDPADGPTNADESSAAEMDRLRTDLREAGDRVLRAQAELDNYRKRARRELDEELRYANLPLLRDLLPVLDNIQRGIAAAEKTPDGSNLLDGIKMVAQSLTGTLARHNCTRIEALHKPFDPALHEAIMQQPSDQFAAHTVLAVVQDGYVLYDRVVRPAQVIVSTAPAAE
jgi:molecular chaperone GrpE